MEVIDEEQLATLQSRLQAMHGSKLLTDDELFERLFARVPGGCELVAFFDCCHSGTMSDLSDVPGAAVGGDVVSKAEEAPPGAAAGPCAGRARSRAPARTGRARPARRG